MNPKETLVEDFFQSVLDRLKVQETNLEITLKVQPADLKVYADSRRLAQVINNLINNASKYAPDSNVEIVAKEQGDKILIEVADDGPGIAEEHLDKLFNRFYRVPDRSGGVRGSGLGLFICKQIVEAHRGKIWVESVVDKGTTFYILLDRQGKIEEDEELND